MDKDESLFTFPCDFTLKVFGLGTPEFEAAVLMIINKHAPSFENREIKSRPSENGKYRALSITLYVTSREQLDNIYRDLSSSPNVIMVI